MLEIEEIQKEVQRRGIEHLLHFTKISNLESILHHGLITRDKIPLDHIEQTCNDQLRLDKTNGICLSVSFPNYRMFYRYRKKFPDVSWIVLGIDPRLLWEKECFFSHTNAASIASRSIPWPQRSGISGFNKMFSDISAQRSELTIPDCYTTDPQAEIMVFENIEKKYIMGYAVESSNNLKLFSIKFPNTKFTHINSFFSYRKDFQYWKDKQSHL